MREWCGVPSEKKAEWQRVFAASTEGLSVSAACPCCGQHGLHRYFGRASPLREARAGYAGRGSSWEWCTSCRAYEHASCLVPSWWRPIQGIAEHELTAEPEQIEMQLKRLGAVGA